MPRLYIQQFHYVCTYLKFVYICIFQQNRVFKSPFMSNESSLADKSTKNTDSSGFTKWELVKILAAIFILLAASLTYYLYVRKEILHNDQKRAEVALKHTENIIRSRFGKVETILGAMQLMAEHELNDPDEMFVIAHYTVKSNPIIKSAGLAFNKYYYPQKGCWFEPAAANIPGIDTLVVEQIGNEGHDYTKMEWCMKRVFGATPTRTITTRIPI